MVLAAVMVVGRRWMKKIMTKTQTISSTTHVANITCGNAPPPTTSDAAGLTGRRLPTGLQIISAYVFLPATLNCRLLPVTGLVIPYSIFWISVFGALAWAFVEWLL